jgi:hypothetical protein
MSGIAQELFNRELIEKPDVILRRVSNPATV